VSDAAGPPEPRDQIAGLTFGLLLLKPDLTIDQVNPAGENLLGRGARKLLGQRFLEVVKFPEGRIDEGLLGGDSQAVARGLPIEVDGRPLVVNLTISPMAAHPGWRVVTLSDVGQEERLGDEEPAPLRGPAVLAHEIKNPLSAIRGAAQLVARKLGEGDRQLTDLITGEVDRIAQLVDRMQRLGREQPEPVAPMNLHAAVRRASESVAAATDSEIPLREEFDPSIPLVLANEGALVQVLINLIGNARDACREAEAPEVVVQTRFASGIARVMRLGRPVKLPIEVQVSDNGPGVDPALRDHIFEPFVSSKPNGQGLGLALVQKLVRDMDGRISHERDGAWTHFRVHLPVAK
jgi:two-component system nitrogen regulation sensor histidine kinase GlnL